MDEIRPHPQKKPLRIIADLPLRHALRQVDMLECACVHASEITAPEGTAIRQGIVGMPCYRNHVWIAGAERRHRISLTGGISACHPPEQYVSS